MNQDELNKFCHADVHMMRIATPWSDENHTYASNGHIIIRVSRIEEVPIRKDAPKIEGYPIEKLFNKEPKKWYPVPEFNIKQDVCPECKGGKGFPMLSKKEPIEYFTCENCEGTGKSWNHRSVEIGGVAFSDVYLSWIAELPESEIGPFPFPDAARFKFNGGDGMLMPRRQ